MKMKKLIRYALAAIAILLVAFTIFWFARPADVNFDEARAAVPNSAYSRFADVDGVPTLADASARIVAEIVSTADCGDHTIFVGHIRHMTADDRPPLLYHAGRFAYLVPAHGEDVPHPEFW